MADLNEIVRRVTFQADTSGLDKVSAAADKAAATTGKLSTATESLSSSTTKSEKSILSVSAQLDRMAKAADPAIAAAAKLETFQQKLNAATKLGRPIAQEWVQGLNALKAKHDELTRATGEHSRSVGLNRMQMMESMHVAKSLADSMIAGASPMRALTMEGGRIAQIFSEGNNGVGGTLRAMGGAVGRLATGWLGLGAAVAAGAGLAAAAVYRFQNQQDRLALSLNGAGRYAGVGGGGLAGIANAAGARNPYLGQGGATALAATFASTGRISAGLMPGLLDLATPYARGTGQGVTKAGEELAKAFADPGKGAEQLNEKLGFLDDKTKQLIASFERQGDLLGAQQTLLAKAADAASRMADRTWGIAKAWGAIESAVGGTFTRVGGAIENAVNGPTTQERLASLYGQINAPRSPSLFGPTPMFGDPAAMQRARNQAKVLGLNYQLYGESRVASDTATRAASDKRTNDLSIQIGVAIRKAVPELSKSQQLGDTLKLLTDALSNPEVLGKVKGGASVVSLAAGRFRTMSSLSDPLLRIQQDSALSAQAAQAETAAERTLIKARRAELDVLRSTGDATQAAAKALATWNDEIAKSNKEADDALRLANRNATMALMRPFERGAAEIRNRHSDMARAAVTGAPTGAILVSALPVAATAVGPYGDMGAAPAAFGGGAYRKSISGIESGGNYGVLGPLTSSGDRAYGKYQIMGANIGPWTKATFGHPMSAQDFLANPSAQDAVFDHQFGGYVKKYGQRDAASMWLTGRTLANGGATARDQNGTTGQAYADRFMSGVGNNSAAAARFAPGNIVIPQSGAIASTSAGTRAQAMSQDLGAYYDAQTLGKLQAAGDELQRQQKLLAARTSAIGKDNDAMQKAVATQELWNSLQLDDGAMRQLGPARIARITSAINDQASAQVSLNDQQNRYNQISGASNWFQQTGNGVVSNLGSSWGSLINQNPRNLVSQLQIGDQAKYYAGQLSGNAVKQKIFMMQAGDFLRNLMFQQGIGMIQHGLFGMGAMGQPGYQPGLLGGVFNSLLGGVMGGGGGASSGSFGGLSSLFSSGFSFANGGVMTSRGAVPLRAYAGGGVANSPQMAVFGEGSNPEAYVPLPDGRRIPVAMKGGGAGHVFNVSGPTLTVQGSIDSATLPQVQAMIADAGRRQASEVQRNVGAIMAKWNQRYGS